MFFILHRFYVGLLLIDYVSASFLPCKCQSIFDTPENIGGRDGGFDSDHLLLVNFGTVLVQVIQ